MVRGKRVGKNEWYGIEYQGIMAKAPPCLERTLKNAVAAAMLAFIQGRRKSVDL